MPQDSTAHINPTGHLTSVGPYNPYNGNEALKLIFKRLWDYCEKHQIFAHHVTYTQFETEFEMRFKGEAIEPVVLKGKETFELRTKDATINITGSSPSAPDDGRREAGLVVPKPTNTLGGMVDIPMQSQTPTS